MVLGVFAVLCTTRGGNTLGEEKGREGKGNRSLGCRSIFIRSDLCLYDRRDNVPQRHMTGGKKRKTWAARRQRESVARTNKIGLVFYVRP